MTHFQPWTGLLSLNAFADLVNPRLVNGAKGGLQVGCGDLIWLPLSVHVCLGLVVEYWPFVGACTRNSYSKLYYLCLLSSLIKLLPPPTPPLRPSCPPLIYTGPILMNFIKNNCKKLTKISHCLLVGLVVQ